MEKKFFILLFLLLVEMLFASSKVDLKETIQDGKRIVIMENNIIKVVLVPEIARLPLSYFYKPTSQEMFVHPEPLSTPNTSQRHVYYGGIIDSLPWVSGLVEGKVDRVRFPVKGYLYFSKWKDKTGRTKQSVWWQGETEITYQDPATNQPSTLLFQKRITAFSHSARLMMDYLIRNTGKQKARFTFDIHSRTAINKYDEGDYFHAPGDRCYLYELVNFPELEARGYQVDNWVDWPLPEATDFRPGKEIRYIMVYLPADWCVVGDDKSKECLFFVAGPVKIERTTDQMKMGIFMTNSGYVVQPCLSYALQANAHRWERPEETVLLEPGETCRFSLSLVAYHGISRAEVMKIDAVLPEVLVLTRPVMRYLEGGEKISLDGEILLSAAGKLKLLTGKKVLAEKEVQPGFFSLQQWGHVQAEEKPVSLYFEGSNGPQLIRTFSPGWKAPSWKFPYKFRKKLKVEKNVVSGELRNFPVLVLLKDMHVKDTRNFLFTAADGLTPLPKEFLSYDSCTNTSSWRVQVPFLSSEKDNIIYVYYGGPARDFNRKSTKVGDAHHFLIWSSETISDLRTTKQNPLTPSINVPLTGNSLTVEAWFYQDDVRAEKMQTLVAKWKVQNSWGKFTAFDAGKTSGLDTTGYLGGVFDGRYVYFSPQHDTRQRHGKVLRYDTQRDFKNLTSWEAYDAGNTSGLNTKGYYGAVFDGNYVYFVPRFDGVGYHSRVLRYDTRKAFSRSSSWEAYDAGLPISYQSAAFDGRYIYFAPGSGQDKEKGHSGKILRYDTHSPFKQKSSWSVYDAGQSFGLKARDFDGAVFDGRYVYFVPLSHSVVLRYDTRKIFTEPDSWAVHDAATTGMGRCVGGIFDGRYVYFVPYGRSRTVVRYDTEKPFEEDTSWQSWNIGNSSDLDTVGYDGAAFDGRYIYFIPFYNEERIFHGRFLRYDTLKDFCNAQAWQAIDAGQTEGLVTIGYNGAVFDGRYLYCVPWHDGAEFLKTGKISGHGRVLRYDTTGENATFVLKYMDCGHNGGLTAAVPGPSFTVALQNNTVATVRASKIPSSGWHHLAGVFDGKEIYLYLDGVLISRQRAMGKLQKNSVPVTIGSLAEGGSFFSGKIKEVRISDTARSSCYLSTTYRNLKDPETFLQAGPEETCPEGKNTVSKFRQKESGQNE